MPDLTRIEETLPAIPGCRPTETSLTINGDVDLELYGQIGSFLGRLSRANQWWLGDWWNGCDRFGEDAGQVMDATGLDYAQLSRLGRVCREVAPERRVDGLSFTHHQEVAKLEPPEQKYYLETAKEENLIKDDLRALIKEECEIPDDGATLASRDAGECEDGQNGDAGVALCYDNSIIDGLFGKLIRSFDDKANVEGNSHHHVACMESINESLTDWNGWKKAK